jgi:hypothetical protein
MNEDDTFSRRRYKKGLTVPAEVFVEKIELGLPQRQLSDIIRSHAFIELPDVIKRSETDIQCLKSTAE